MRYGTVEVLRALIKMTTQENRRRRIPKALRALVWNTHIGEDRGVTVCLCGTRISQLTFECGHIIPYARGGHTTVENLYPICGSCNRSMGTNHYATFSVAVTGRAPRGMRLPLEDDWVLVPLTTSHATTWSATLAKYWWRLRGGSDK